MDFSAIGDAKILVGAVGAAALGGYVAGQVFLWVRMVIEQRADARYDAAHDDRRS